ncbi:putative lipid II flippase FtsW [Lysobacter sp. HDW10]|uniref:putative lipid II flippase FtsW n=1 Tax=Lysobacter sp. HDW10 TaxID=2714936 RepID=UPI00140DCD97|nr:putative lipid II flippase FtsW [Lysobacter sp. HDW10]QIK80367.1 putative lipid II flippase FtsW [Lysobacter sp. HDW10]
MAAVMHRPFSSQATRVDAIGGHYDTWLLLCISSLLAFGTVMVGSASFPEAVDNGGGPFTFLIKHLIFLVAGIAGAYLVMRTELKDIERYSHWFPILAAVMLLLVLVPGLGITVKGARRWIGFGPARFQPVEAAKLLMIVWLASYLVRFRDEVGGTWTAMFKALGVALFLGAILLVVQKDFGSTALLMALTAGMLVLGGVHLKRLIIPLLVLLPAAALMIIIEPYRVRRLTSYMDPWSDPQGSGYQLTNALMAIGRGEFWGVGLGGSVQKLSYLPEAHTDFIMSVISEELGFIGTCCLMGVYALLVGRAFWVGLKCVDMGRYFSGFCAFGIGLWIAIQSFVSMGVNVGLLPTKGLTLPLISYGGSSLTVGCVAMGLLLRVSFELNKATRQRNVMRPEHTSADDVMSPSADSAVRTPLRDTLPPLSNVADRVASLLRRTEKTEVRTGSTQRVEPVMQTEGRR